MISTNLYCTVLAKRRAAPSSGPHSDGTVGTYLEGTYLSELDRYGSTVVGLTPVARRAPVFVDLTYNQTWTTCRSTFVHVYSEYHHRRVSCIPSPSIPTSSSGCVSMLIATGTLTLML